MYAIKPLIQGATLTTSNAVYYTAPTGLYTKVTMLTLINTDASSHTVSVYFATGSGAPATADYIVKSKTLMANESYSVYVGQGWVVQPTATIQAIADANSVVVIKAAGTEFSQ
jgi:hypothetical protein